MDELQELRKKLKELQNPERAKVSQRFFKTGQGEYGEGDIFIGISVPDTRKIAAKFKDLDLGEIQVLLTSKIHEERLLSLIILVYKFEKSSEEVRKNVFDFYLKNTQYINNWDLVDSSADKIVGAYLWEKKQSLFNRHSGKRGTSASRINAVRNSGQSQNDRENRFEEKNILYKLAKSENLWERRISMIATYQFIKNGEYKETFEIAEILLHDKHDLIQKAVGWMLREVGKRISEEKEIEFLNKHYRKMPRTMLRYAIEHFSETKRKYYLRS